jgi:hypothetical protein
MKPQLKIKKLKFNLSPTQGISSLINCTLDGYVITQIERKGTKAIVTYAKRPS